MAAKCHVVSTTAIASRCDASACSGASGSSPLAGEIHATPTPVAQTPDPQASATTGPSEAPSSKPGSTATPTPAPAQAASILAEYPLSSSGAPAARPVFAGDGNLWYAPPTGTTLYSVTPAGVVAAHPSAYAGTGGAIADLIAGPDGSPYYVSTTGSSATPNQIRHMTTAGSDALVAAPANIANTTIAFNAAGTKLDASSYAQHKAAAPSTELVAKAAPPH